MKLFCKHKYSLYYVGTYYPLCSWNTYERYEFVCKNCGKTMTIFSRLLDEELICEKENTLKNRVLNNQKENTECIETFCMKTFSDHALKRYTGEYVNNIKYRYNKKGIDLDEITNYYSKDKFSI